jgi:CheY-like chemotaxis protein
MGRSARKESRLRRDRILLVEDDPFSRRSLAKLLERAGFEVEAVDEGPAALARIERPRPALVLLDLMLPGMDGIEVLRRIRTVADRDALPVIVLSGDVLSGRSTELRTLDVNGIVAKPVDFDELVEMIRYCLPSSSA